MEAKAPLFFFVFELYVLLYYMYKIKSMLRRLFWVPKLNVLAEE